jgi:hypothetical protein
MCVSLQTRVSRCSRKSSEQRFRAGRFEWVQKKAEAKALSSMKRVQVRSMTGAS